MINKIFFDQISNQMDLYNVKSDLKQQVKKYLNELFYSHYPELDDLSFSHSKDRNVITSGNKVIIHWHDGLSTNNGNNSIIEITDNSLKITPNDSFLNLYFIDTYDRKLENRTINLAFKYGDDLIVINKSMRSYRVEDGFIAEMSIYINVHDRIKNNLSNIGEYTPDFYLKGERETRGKYVLKLKNCVTDYYFPRPWSVDLDTLFDIRKAATDIYKFYRSEYIDSLSSKTR